ncbi:hypothetical protein Hanom_Chr10g00912311 [Helianthus anomalus]
MDPNLINPTDTATKQQKHALILFLHLHMDTITDATSKQIQQQANKSINR